MEHDGWRDAEERLHWRSFRTAARLLFDALERRLQHDVGLPYTYYEILVRLSEAADRSLRMSELARSLLLSPSRLSHAVARLEEAGLVRRRAHPADRRGAVAQLTDAGWARLRDAAPGHVEAVRTHLFDRLDAEQVRTLRRISDTLVAELTQEEGRQVTSAAAARHRARPRTNAEPPPRGPVPR